MSAVRTKRQDITKLTLRRVATDSAGHTALTSCSSIPRGEAVSCSPIDRFEHGLIGLKRGQLREAVSGLAKVRDHTAPPLKPRSTAQKRDAAESACPVLTDSAPRQPTDTPSEMARRVAFLEGGASPQLAPRGRERRDCATAQRADLPGITAIESGRHSAWGCLRVQNH